MMKENFTGLWNHRQLIFKFTKREIESRFRGSLLGKAWVIINHLSLIAIYTFVFSFVLHTKIKTSQGVLGMDFAIWLYCGLLPWLALNEAMSIAVKDVVSKVNYVKKIVFPLEVLPVVSVLSSLFNMLIGLVMLLIGMLWLGHGLHWTMLLLPLLLIPFFFFMSGINMLLASLGVYFRDLGQLIGLISMVWMYATPILYTSDMIPKEYQTIFNTNPLTHIVEYFRDTLFWGKVPDFAFLGWFTAGSLAIFLLGSIVFRKIKVGFADVL